MPEDPSAIKFLVRDNETGVNSYAWRIGWHNESFYIGPLYAPLMALKVSLHGPDYRNPVNGFLYGQNQPSVPKALAAGGGWIGPTERSRFTGTVVTPEVLHVIRMRWTWDLFRAMSPSGPVPAEPKKTDLALVVQAPSLLMAADVDIFFCEGEPHWPHEARARRDNAVLGPLYNGTGQCLTGEIHHRSLLKSFTPADVVPPPLNESAKIRGLRTAHDTDGLLWIIERWTPAGIFEDPPSQPMPLDVWLDGPEWLRRRRLVETPTS